MVSEQSDQAGALAVARWTREECRIVRQTIHPKLSAEELDQLASYCNRSGLEILLDQVYVSRFKSQEGSKLKIEATIEGHRAAAARHPDYAGQGNPQWMDEDGEIWDWWTGPVPPAAARIEVYRRGDERSTIGVARYQSYVQKSNGQPTGNWASMPEVMLAAAAERQALSKAFPLQHIEPVSAAPGDDGLE